MSGRYQKITKGCLAGVYKVSGKNQESVGQMFGGSKSLIWLTPLRHQWRALLQKMSHLSSKLLVLEPKQISNPDLGKSALVRYCSSDRTTINNSSSRSYVDVDFQVKFSNWEKLLKKKRLKNYKIYEIQNWRELKNRYCEI